MKRRKKKLGGDKRKDESRQANGMSSTQAFNGQDAASGSSASEQDAARNAQPNEDTAGADAPANAGAAQDAQPGAQGVTRAGDAPDGSRPDVDGEPAGGTSSAADAVSDEILESVPKAELSQAERERDMYKDALVRERADFENYKKRNATLSQQSYDSGLEHAVSSVLPIMDNFERALATPCADTAYAEGMKMIMRQFQGVLEALGVEEVDTSGAFDPEVHHAVMQVEDEGLASNQVAETLQKGYKMGSKVVRPAMVKVSK